MKHIIVDSSALVYAAFYSQGVLSYGGKPTGVIYGFLRKIMKIAETYDSNKFYFCFDHPVNRRKKVFTAYKEGRRKDLTPREVKAHKLKDDQQGELREFVLPKMGFKNIVRQEGVEADDFLAIIADKLKAKKVLMVTSDNDLYQCLDVCDILNPSTMKLFTKKHFIEKYKVQPSQWAVCKAIGGCSGDNVIGIKGASDPKNEASKALKYVRGELRTGVIYERITSDEGKEIVRRNLPIVTCPYKPEDIEHFLRRRDKFTTRKFIKVFSKYGFKSMLETEQFDKWIKYFIR